MTEPSTRGHVEKSTPDEGNAVFPCIRCGVCCSGYQVQMTVAEARELADNLRLPWARFVEMYLDPRWPGRDTLVVHHEAGKCVFLDQEPGSAFGLCRIHAFKPLACRQWKSDIDRKECRQGLNRYWNLTVDEEGKLNGSPDDQRCFQTFVETL